MSIPVWFVEREIPMLYSFQPTPAKGLSPASRCALEYLNEGGANLVYRILPKPHGELPTILKSRLLRLRKDLPHIPTAEEQLKALDEDFRPLFARDNLVEHELIALDQNLPLLLNDALQKTVRPGHRSGDFLPVEQMSALLVTDMTPDTGEVLLQIKPKWLAQSPTAPPNARRCRTCALRAHRASQRIRTATDAQETCPLDLINPNLEQRREAIHALTTDRRLREYLLDQCQTLLQQLRSCQIAFDKCGVLKTSDAGSISSLCKAMTLRDCTLFLKRSGNAIEARLGDLDLKQPEKLAKWEKVESTLLDEGWYLNSEADESWTREEICALART
ncbi:inositol-pentakisphosphate 2-kinase [Lecanosticta acicola]|uniref:Inositol-pentakisphosphate 2-kinase n=1 Tax=Lecanosticta acicola TaxID=111012 RepID=A0AAI8YUD3_9PEZI|nr:inositol-pentakisphosphate 2-kinase [Lecanosticta acicola]